MKTLIIETEKNCDTLEGVLNSYELEIEITSTYADGLRIIEWYKPHLILCGFDRPWIFMKMLTINSGIKIPRPYAVALLNFKTQREEALCEEFGFDECKEKPICVSELICWIHKVQELVSKTVDKGK